MTISMMMEKDHSYHINQLHMWRKQGAPRAHAPPPNQPEVGTVPPGPLPEPLKPCKNMLSMLCSILIFRLTFGREGKESLGSRLIFSKSGKSWSHYYPNITEWIKGSFMDYNATRAPLLLTSPSAYGLAVL